MAKITNSIAFRKKTKTKRKGVHSKCKQSSHKGAKNYQKQYVGQGR